jgi:hypothetical protein
VPITISNSALAYYITDFIHRSVFEAIEKYTKTKYGYSSIVHTDESEPLYKNEMPRYVGRFLAFELSQFSCYSYFTAETYVFPLFFCQNSPPIKNIDFQAQVFIFII